MARNLLKRYNNVEEYNRVKCTLDIRQISLINTYKDTKYGTEYDNVTSVYKVRNRYNNIKLFNNTTLINSMISMNINGNDVEPTNEFQFDNYENATIECEFCNLTSIPNAAFSDCTFLTSIEIPSCVTSIGASAFTNCISLTSIDIPNSVTSIGNEAFYYCYLLNSIDIPNSVTSIGNNAFNKCFSLTSITIPSGVTSIGASAFTSCLSFTNITIPNSVKTIGSRAFYNCPSFTNITIPNSVKTIGNYAFSGCTSLSEITCLTKTAPTIESNTFNSICYNGILYYPQGSDYSSWLSTSNLGYYNWVGVKLQYAYDFKVNFITNGVRVASPYNSLIINGIQGVKQSDKSYLFSGLQPTDGCYEFDLIADGEVIEKVDIKHNNKWVLVGDNSTMLTCIYKPCQSTRIYSGNNLTYSGAYVDGVYVDTLTSSYTFNDVSEHIIQYSGVTTIGASAFQNCYSLTSIDIPNSVTTIGASAFYCCYFLTSIEIPNSVKTIGKYAFYNCYSLSNITIPSGVTSIGGSAFNRCYSLTSIDIPNSVTSISNDAFTICLSLTSIDIPSGVTKISNNVFYSCISLSSITIPNSVKTIGNNAFSGCTSLNSITIPSGVTSIGNNAFYNCYSLSNITIPSGVTSIGTNAFTSCSSLSEITCLAETAPTVSSNTFSNISSLGILYYTSLNSSYDAWKQYLPNWEFIQL